MSEDIKIDKLVPIPIPNRQTIFKMKKGDSVLFKEYKKALAFCGSMKRMKVSSVRRKEKDGIRVWRIL